MAHGYEYATAVQYLTPIPISGMPDFGKKQTQIQFMGEFQKLDKNLPKILDELDGGGWTINSRSITLHGDTLIISYLLQRLII